MSIIDKIKEYEAAKENLKTEALVAIKEECSKIFESDSTIHSICFGAKISEYDDEGMFPGITGPEINANDDEYYWIYSSDTVDARVKDLEILLKELGAEILCSIWDDEYIVTVVPTRTKVEVSVDAEHYSRY